MLGPGVAGGREFWGQDSANAPETFLGKTIITVIFIVVVAVTVTVIGIGKETVVV